jgi:hypothetical protein
MREVHVERHARWGAFIAEAEGTHPPAAELVPSVRVLKMHSLLKKLWRLAWHNNRKQLYWRMLVNGLPFSSRFDLGISCICGAGPHAADPGRLHHFWECTAARAVVAVVARECRCDVDEVQRRHLWLMVVPPVLVARYGSHAWLKQVWHVVCLAALNAMWSAAQCVLRGGHGVQGVPPSPPSITTAMLCSTAVLQFRMLLEEFVAVGRPPRAWARLLPANAPFFQAGAAGGAALHVHISWV